MQGKIFLQNFQGKFGADSNWIKKYFIFKSVWYRKIFTKHPVIFKLFKKMMYCSSLPLTIFPNQKNNESFTCFFLILEREIRNSHIFKLTAVTTFLNLFIRYELWIVPSASIKPNLTNHCGTLGDQFFSPSIIKTKAHSETYQTSKMELFLQNINGWKPSIIFGKSSILDVWQGFEYASVIEMKLTLWAPTPQNGQAHSNNSSASCRRIVWVCLTILWEVRA